MWSAAYQGIAAPPLSRVSKAGPSSTEDVTEFCYDWISSECVRGLRLGSGVFLCVCVSNTSARGSMLAGRGGTL